jgi:hypothetical protein
MFLLYRSSIPFGRLVFAVNSVDRVLGEKVTVKGWYRRGLMPYIEMSRIDADLTTYKRGIGTITLFRDSDREDAPKSEHMVSRSYSRWIQTAAAALCTAIGLIWLFA